MVGIRQRVVLRIKIVQHPRVFAKLRPELFQRGVLRLELHRRDIFDREQLPFQPARLLARIAVVDPDDNLALGLQISNGKIDIEGKQRHTPGNEQAGQDNADRRETHEPVMENAAHALLQEITKTHAVLHIRNTHLFGH